MIICLKMPESYMIIARKVFFSVFFLGGGYVPSLSPSSPTHVVRIIYGRMHVAYSPSVLTVEQIVSIKEALANQASRDLQGHRDPSALQVSFYLFAADTLVIFRFFYHLCWVA